MHIHTAVTHVHSHKCAHAHRQFTTAEMRVTVAEVSNWLRTAASAKDSVLLETCQYLAPVTLIFLCRTARCHPAYCHVLQWFPQLLLRQCFCQSCSDWNDLPLLHENVQLHVEWDKRQNRETSRANQQQARSRRDTDTARSWLIQTVYQIAISEDRVFPSEV